MWLGSVGVGMARRQDRTLWIIKIGIPIMTFFSGMAWNAWQIAGSIATKPMLEQVDTNGRKYTDDRTDQLKKYTDALAENVRQDAYSHIDKSRADLQQMILMQGSDLKAQGVKMDMVLDTVRELRTVNRRGK